MTKPREDFLNLAKACGAKLTGKPDGSEAVTVVFTVEAFDAACLTQAHAEGMGVFNEPGSAWRKGTR